MLGLFSLAILPVNVVGVLLLGLGIAPFIGELFAPGFGDFAVGGAVAFVLASVFLFDETEGVSVDPLVAVPTAVVLAVLAITLAGWSSAPNIRPRRSGAGLFTGRVVTVEEISEKEPTQGRAFVDGSWWRVRSTGEQLHDGQQVEVIGMDGLTLVVEADELGLDSSLIEGKGDS